MAMVPRRTPLDPLLVFESLLDSGRNSASFFLMLIVAMGYGVVRPSLDPRIMIRVKALTAVHLICGCLYSVGIVLLTIEAGGTWVFLFIFPLAFTLTGFMMWTLTSLKATMEYLQSRETDFQALFFQETSSNLAWVGPLSSLPSSSYHQ